MSNEEIVLADKAENNEFYSESTQNNDSPSDESVDEKELLFQSSSDLMLYLDKHGKIARINRAGIAFSGFSEDEIIGQFFWKLPGVFSKHNISKYLKVFKNVLKGKPTKNFLNELHEKSGKKHIMNFSTYPIKENEKITSILVVAKDLTEQKEAEDKYRLITEKTDDLIAIATFSLNPKYTYINPSHEKMLGYLPGDMIGKSSFDFIHSEDRKNLLLLLKKYVGAKGKKIFTDKDSDMSANIEYRAKDKSGELHYLKSTVNLVGNELIFASKDVTDHRKAEEKTKQQNEINTLRAEIWELTAQPLSEDELIQQLVDKIGPFFNLEHVSFLRIYPKKKKVIVDIQWRAKDRESGIGEEFPLWPFKRYSRKPYKIISLRNIPSVAKPMIAPIFKKFGVKSTLLVPYGDIGNPQGYIATATRKADKKWSKGEIGVFSEAVGIISLKTEETKAEEKAKKHQRKIEKQNIKLKRLDRIKTDFLNSTSHELRTPMAAIKGYIQMLLRQTMGDITPDQKDALNVILRNTNRLDHLIQDILDISRLESGTMKFIPEKTDTRQMVEEIAETMQSSADLKNIKIHRELEENLPSLNIDSERIKQVIMNLINNAIKFSPDGSIINIKAKKNVDDILFEIQDFGRGIPKNKQKKIFEKFYQVESGMDREFGGTGLGLTISQDIVNVHGGRIWVDSINGKGSTFRFTLPVESVKDIKR